MNTSFITSGDPRFYSGGQVAPAGPTDSTGPHGVCGDKKTVAIRVLVEIDGALKMERKVLNDVNGSFIKHIDQHYFGNQDPIVHHVLRQVANICEVHYKAENGLTEKKDDKEREVKPQDSSTGVTSKDSLSFGANVAPKGEFEDSGLLQPLVEIRGDQSLRAFMSLRAQEFIRIAAGVAQCHQRERQSLLNR